MLSAESDNYLLDSWMMIQKRMMSLRITVVCSRPSTRHRFEEDLEAEAKAEKHMTNAKKELRRKTKESGGSSIKCRKIESDEESPPRKAATHRRKAIVFDSNDD